MLPLALSAPAVTGIAAVAGALVGATAGGIVEVAMENRREAKLAKAAARLMAADLKAADVQLRDLESDGKWWRHYDLSISNWAEHRSVLATRLDSDSFAVVSELVVTFQSMSEHVPRSPSFQKPETVFVEIEASNIAVLRKGAASAYNELAPLAGYDRVDGLLTSPRVSQPIRARDQD